MEHVIMMHAKDNIAIVMAPSLAVGSEFTVGGKMVCAKDELPFAHKVAIKAIPKGGQIDFVLGKFPPEEREKMPEVLKRAAEAVSTFCLAGPDIAMNRFNH